MSTDCSLNEESKTSLRKELYYVTWTIDCEGGLLASSTSNPERTHKECIEKAEYHY